MLTARIIMNIRHAAYYDENDTRAQLSPIPTPEPLVFEMQPLAVGESGGPAGDESFGTASRPRSSQETVALSEGTYQDSLNASLDLETATEVGGTSMQGPDSRMGGS